jgi:hypothetical protein
MRGMCVGRRDLLKTADVDLVLVLDCSTSRGTHTQKLQHAATHIWRIDPRHITYFLVLNIVIYRIVHCADGLTPQCAPFSRCSWPALRCR